MAVSDEEFVIFGHWVAKEGQVDRLSQAVFPVLDYARSTSDDIPCLYLLNDTVDGTRGNEILMISWFKDKQAYQRYLDCPAISNLKDLCERQGLLQKPQENRMVYPRTGFPHRSTTHSDPFVVIASIRYKPGRRTDGLELWKNITSSVKDEEEEAYSYLFLADAEDENLVWSFERYKDERFLREVHVRSDGIQRNIGLQKDMRVSGGLHHWFWTQIAEIHETI